MTRFLTIVLALGTLLACGGDENIPDAATGTPDAPGAIDAAAAIDAAPPSPDADTSGFVVTSTAFVDGGVIPETYTCNGENISPDLSWTAWPGALSYAVVFNDATTDFLHSSIYDIDPATLALPGEISTVFQPPEVSGAKQSRNYAGQLGYAGPCPGSEHTYEFIVMALDVASLAGTDNMSTVGEVVDLLEPHVLATTRLTGSYNPP